MIQSPPPGYGRRSIVQDPSKTRERLLSTLDSSGFYEESCSSVFTTLTILCSFALHCRYTFSPLLSIAKLEEPYPLPCAGAELAIRDRYND